MRLTGDVYIFIRTGYEFNVFEIFPERDRKRVARLSTCDEHILLGIQ